METSAIQTAKRITLLNIIAAELAFPAVLAFAWLYSEGDHTGPLGFFLIWLMGVGLIFRIYAQFLRLWHRVGYPKAAILRQRTERTGVGSSLAVLVAQDTTLLTGALTIRSANVTTKLALPVSNEPCPQRGAVATTKNETGWMDDVQEAWAKAETPATRAAA